MEEPRRIRLMSDDVVEYPLWDDEGLINVAELGLSDELLSDIKSWAYADAFRSREDSRSSLRRRGKALVGRLQAEAGPGYHFELRRESLAATIGERIRRVFVYPFKGPPPDGDAR